MDTLNKKSQDHSAAIKNFEKQYRNSYGVIAGYLPQEIEHLGVWLSDRVEAAHKYKEAQGEEYVLLPPVNALATILNNDPTKANQVTAMIQEGLIIHQIYEPNVKYSIYDIQDMLITLNFMIISAPLFSPVKHTAFPMSALFVYMMATATGWNVFREVWFNDALRGILNWWCDYLDSTASLDAVVTTYDPESEIGGWLCPLSAKANNLYEFVTPEQKKADPIHWGFTSLNDYFHREIIASYRPLAGKNDRSVVVSPNDGTVYRLARDVKRETEFAVKSQPYSLVNMLNNTPFVDDFVHGDVLQTFLSGHDYHRWHAPISGTVLYAEVVPGYMFSELLQEGFDSSAGTNSQGYEANVNTRAIIIIDSGLPNLGKVCVMPIGITEISSITIDPKAQEGCSVVKGQELGRFSYGGSSMCILFQKGAIQGYILPKHVGKKEATVKVNGQIAIANL